jgi:hypothetical protein
MSVNKRIEQIIFEGIDRLSPASKSAKESSKDLRKSLDDVKEVLGAIGVTVGAGAMLKLAHDALSATAALDDMAEITGASVEGLSAIQRVAKVGGHDFDGLSSQISKMIKGLRDGTDEGNKAAQAFRFLGIDVRNTNGTWRDTSEVLVELARKIDKYRESGDKNLLIQDALGRGADRYIPLLKDLAEGTDLHATVTRRQAEEAEKAEKNINRLKVTMEDARRELVNDFTPGVNKLAEAMLAANSASDGFIRKLQLFFSIAGPQGDDPLSKIEEVEKRLADLRRLREALAGDDSITGRLNRMLNPEDKAILDHQIKFAEQERQALQALLQRRVSGNAAGMVEDVAGIHPAPAKPALDYRSEDLSKQRRDAEVTARQIAEGEEETLRVQREAQDAYQKYFAGVLEDRQHLVEQIETENGDKIVQVTERVVANTERARQIETEMFKQWFAEIDQEQDDSIAKGAEWLQILEEQRARETEIAQGVLGKTFATEFDEEQFRAMHAYRLELLVEALEQGRVTEAHYLLQRELMEQDHQDALYRIEDAAIKRKFGISKVHRKLDLDAAKTFLGSMSQLMNTNSRKMFELGKIAAIGETVINTYKAATGAYAALSSIPYVGPALGAAAAAAAIAAGMANVAAIKAQSFGGGGGGATATFPANPSTGLPVTQPGGQVGEGQGQATIINFNGTEDEEKLIRRFSDKLNENARNGGRFIIAGRRSRRRSFTRRASSSRRRRPACR